MLTFLKHIIMILLTSLGIVIALLLSMILFNRQLPLQYARKYWSPLILKICGIKIDIKGLDNIDQSATNIFVCNHLSYIDIPCLFYSIPKNLHFIAKESLKRIPFLGWFMSYTGMIFVDRGNRQKSIASLKKAAQLIGADRNVLVFPEGSRGDGITLQTFKKGAFHLAQQSEAVLVPIGIRGSSKIWPRDSFKLGSGPVQINIGKGISTKGLSREDVNGLIKRVKEQVADLGQYASEEVQ